MALHHTRNDNNTKLTKLAAQLVTRPGDSGCFVLLLCHKLAFVVLSQKRLACLFI